MSVVAGNASRGVCNIWIQRLKIVPVANAGCADVRAQGLTGNGFQADAFKFVGGTVVRIDRPQADQFEIEPRFAVAN